MYYDCQTLIFIVVVRTYIVVISLKISITNKSALLIVDMQKDFCEGGALPVTGCNALVPIINDYIVSFVSKKRPVIASRDWHPPNHKSFKDRGGPWPPHCVQETKGAEFHEGLKLPNDTIVISKAFLPDKEAYSAFDGTELHYILNKLGINRLFICGVATEYCVKATALDAVALGYQTILLVDAVAGVNSRDAEEAIKEMLSKGVILASKEEIS